MRCGSLGAIASCSFGQFDLDLSTGELRRSGRPVHLAPQPTRVLVALAERAGELVTRDELRAAVWDSDTFVDFEQGLTFCVKQIRAALGDEAESPRYIETVPRRGYRFIAPVSRTSQAGTPAAPPPPAQPRGRSLPWVAAGAVMAVAAAVALMLWWREPRAAATTKTMIAVLPFENLSGDATQDLFSSGFAGELIGQLGQVDPDRLGVIARTSTQPYRDTAKSAAEIGRELRVQHLVEGTVRRSGHRVRVTAQLIRVADQSQVWAEIFEGDVRDVLGLQRDVGQSIARHVIGALGPAASPAPRKIDPATYEVYLRAREFWNRRVSTYYEQAVGAFAEAIRRDPSFAEAYAGLADAQVAPQPALALAAAEKALALDDRLAEAHGARAHVLMHMLRWDQAEAAFRRAIALDPSYVPARYFYAEYLTARGRHRQAVEQARHAIALDPFSAIAAHAAGVTFYYAGDYDEALRLLRRALALDPGHIWSHWRIALVHERRREFDAAIREFDLAGIGLRSLPSRLAAGRTAEARRILDAAEDSEDADIQSFQLAAAHAALNQHKDAMKWLTIAVRRQVYDVIYLQVEPRFESLRTLPEFRELLRRGGWE